MQICPCLKQQDVPFQTASTQPVDAEGQPNLLQWVEFCLTIPWGTFIDDWLDGYPLRGRVGYILQMHTDINRKALCRQMSSKLANLDRSVCREKFEKAKFYQSKIDKAERRNRRGNNMFEI